MNTYSDELRNLIESMPPENRALNADVLGLPAVPAAGKPDSPKPSKWHNVRTPYNGVTYDSKAEARKAQELDLQVKAGEIDFWIRQVPFPLSDGEIYRADFVTFHQAQTRGSSRTWDSLFSACKRCTLFSVTVIEVKGFMTPDARRKLKIFKKRYPNLSIEVVK